MSLLPGLEKRSPVQALIEQCVDHCVLGLGGPRDGGLLGAHEGAQNIFDKC